MEESYFDKIEQDIKKEHTFFVDFGFDFAKQVKYVLSIHPTIKTQKDLAIAMGKRESEISKMLTGLHNLTLESISKMCGVLDYDLILTDIKAQHKYNSHLVSVGAAESHNYYILNINITVQVYNVLPAGTVGGLDFLNEYLHSSFMQPIAISSDGRQILS